MPIEKIRRIAKPRCDNCSFSTFATGPGRLVLICRQKKGSEGRWKTRPLLQKCPNFHPSRAANPKNHAPRLIPLTRGLFAIVDTEDYPSLSRYTWFAEDGPKTYYAVRKENGKSIKMHRQILNAPGHLVVDHIDHNGRNNQKANPPARNINYLTGKSLLSRIPGKADRPTITQPLRCPSLAAREERGWWVSLDTYENKQGLY